MSEVDEDEEENHHNRAKVGRPRKYVGGWTSVSNILVKQIKLHTSVYLRWCKLKGARQHSEFATFLLDLYEEHVLRNGESHVEARFVFPEAEIKVPANLSEQIESRSTVRKNNRRKISTNNRKQQVHIQCYEDKHLANDLRRASMVSPISHLTFKKGDEQSEIPCKKTRNEDGVKSESLKPAIQQNATLLQNLNLVASNNGVENPILMPLASAGNLNTVQTIGIVKDNSVEIFQNKDYSAAVSVAKSMATATTSHLMSTSSLTVSNDVIMTPVAVTRQQLEQKPLLIPVEIPGICSPTIATVCQTSSMPVKPLFVLNPDIASVSAQNKLTQNLTKEVAILPKPLISESKKREFLKNLSKFAECSPAFTAANEYQTQITSCTATQMSTPKSPSEVVDSNDSTEVVETEDSGRTNYVCTEKEKLPELRPVDSFRTSESELDVAQIMSNLSYSIPDKNENLKTKTSNQNSRKTPIASCSCHKSLTPGSHKKIKLVKLVRHMATQFTTQALNIKSFRHVATQTWVNRISVGTITEEMSLKRSVQTQDWPSNLWTKYLIRHPEVVYNIDSGDLKDFPPRFRLYKKDGKMYSTLFGPAWLIQKRPCMRCISVSEYGGPKVLRILGSMPTPKPNEHQVLINVKVAGVNSVDIYIRSGTHAIKPTLPYIPGKGGAGIVQQLGESVTKVKKGDRVWFIGSLTGSYAEYCICYENDIGVLPKHISFEEGAMLGIPYLTAYKALFQRARIKRGETVLIHGATGGIGTAAIQICQSMGVNIIATAGSDEGIQSITSFGVQKIYNHCSENYIEQIKKSGLKIDVILEMLPNTDLEKNCEIAKVQCRIVVVHSSNTLTIESRSLMDTEAFITGVNLSKCAAAERQEQINFLTEGLNSGLVKPILWKVLELEFAKTAHREIFESSGAKGQIVLKINPSSTAAEYVPTDL